MQCPLLLLNQTIIWDLRIGKIIEILHGKYLDKIWITRPMQNPLNDMPRHATATLSLWGIHCNGQFALVKVIT